MSFTRIVFLFLFLIASGSAADSNTTIKEHNYIDDTHDLLSEKILEYSKAIDTTVRDWVLYFDQNSTEIKNKKISMDEFFKNEKYIDDTDKAFVRLVLNSNFQSKSESDYTYSLKAHIPLSRSKKKLNLFIRSTFRDDDDDDDQLVNNIATNPNDKYATTELGVDFFAAKTYDFIKPKYSAGIRRLDPFVRAKYKIELESGIWDIELSQLFKYTLEDKFSEKTNIYFDTKPDDSTLFRVTLHRDTEEESTGMDYGIGFHYYISTKKNSAIRISQTFSGNTEYRYAVDDSADSTKTKKYGGINNCSTSISWRKNIFKEWIFYEVTPSANFSRHGSYKENYSLNFLLEFYFGRFKNK